MIGRKLPENVISFEDLMEDMDLTSVALPTTMPAPPFVEVSKYTQFRELADSVGPLAVSLLASVENAANEEEEPTTLIPPPPLFPQLMCEQPTKQWDDLGEYDETERVAITASRAAIPEEMLGLPVFGQIVKKRMGLWKVHLEE